MELRVNSAQEESFQMEEDVLYAQLIQFLKLDHVLAFPVTWVLNQMALKQDVISVLSTPMQ